MHTLPGAQALRWWLMSHWGHPFRDGFMPRAAQKRVAANWNSPPRPDDAQSLLIYLHSCGEGTPLGSPLTPTCQPWLTSWQPAASDPSLPLLEEGPKRRVGGAEDTALKFPASLCTCLDQGRSEGRPCRPDQEEEATRCLFPLRSQLGDPRPSSPVPAAPTAHSGEHLTSGAPAGPRGTERGQSLRWGGGQVT